MIVLKTEGMIFINPAEVAMEHGLRDDEWYISCTGQDGTNVRISKIYSTWGNAKRAFDGLYEIIRKACAEGGNAVVDVEDMA